LWLSLLLFAKKRSEKDTKYTRRALRLGSAVLASLHICLPGDIFDLWLYILFFAKKWSKKDTRYTRLALRLGSAVEKGIHGVGDEGKKGSLGVGESTKWRCEGAGMRACMVLVSFRAHQRWAS
jgi:hypothetical protein